MAKKNKIDSKYYLLDSEAKLDSASSTGVQNNSASITEEFAVSFKEFI